MAVLVSISLIGLVVMTCLAAGRWSRSGRGHSGAPGPGQPKPIPIRSIGGPDASLLLGQNVLTRLGTWSIDSHRAVLLVDEPPRGRSSAECANWRTAPDDCEVAAVRDFLRDIRPPHDVTSLMLLRSDGERASVLVDAVRDGRRRTARLCGPMDLRRAEAGWRVVAASGLYEVGRDAPCRP